MENKKPIIIAVIVLLILATGWLLMGKYNYLKGGKNGKPPAVSESKKTTEPNKKETSSITPVATDIFPITGTVERVDNDILTLETEARGLTMEVTPDYSVFLLEGEKEIAAKLTELKEGSRVKIRYKGPILPEDKKFNPTNANQGLVTAIDDISMTLQMESGEKIVDISAKPSIYMMDGNTSVAKTAADIKVGSVVALAYSDEADKAVVVVIRIDKL